MKKIKVVLFALATTTFAIAQERVITTGVPFLLVAADARAAGMGDQGVATTPDAFSQQWNPSKYAFSEDRQGFSVSYTPYLSSLVNDISLSQVTYFNKLNEKSAFAGSIRYFSLGQIQLTDQNGASNGIVKPSEFAIDGSYALKLSEKFSMSVAGRFISSNLRLPTDGQTGKAANSFAFDVSGFYHSDEIAFNDFNGRLRFGFNLQNIGPKINYDLSQTDVGSNFLPANLRLGTGFDFILDEYNKVSINFELTKLLVPTPPKVGDVDENNDGLINNADAQIAYDRYRKIGWVAGIGNALTQAPDGFSEKLKEITYAGGLEYLYQDSFALRLGYFNENPNKGARQFFTLGAGFKYNVVKVDVSYLFSASKVKNPLENTLRFSLTFNFGDKYENN